MAIVGPLNNHHADNEPHSIRQKASQSVGMSYDIWPDVEVSSHTRDTGRFTKMPSEHLSDRKSFLAEFKKAALTYHLQYRS